MRQDRRELIAGLAVAGMTAFGLTGAAAAPAPFSPVLGPRSRMLFVNDLAGDVDGLFAAAHAALSPSTDLRGIVATGTGVPTETAARAATLAREMLRIMGRTDVPVVEGAPARLRTPDQPDRSAGVMAILDEARRTDTDLPLFVAVGGGLSEVASALLIDPAIATRLTLIWIGGAPYPAGGRGEYNFAIDPVAAQHVFNGSEVPLWQIPRDVYATCQVSFAELQARVATRGPLGEWLYGKAIAASNDLAKRFRLNTGETWTLGDNPLVLLSALTAWPPSSFGKVRRYDSTGSSLFDEPFAPRLLPDGSYQPRQDGRRIRVYRTVDTRMMLEDMFAKLDIAAHH